MRKLLVLIAVFVIAAAGSAVAAKIEGRGFFNYSYDLAPEGSDLQKFEADRLYVTLKENLEDTISVKVTLDLNYASKATETNVRNMMVKYMYIQFADIMGSGVSVIAGIQDTPWIGYIDGIAGLRYMIKSLMDIEGVQSSSDLGVGVKATLLDKIIEIHGIFSNGEGYKKLDTNRYKEGSIRLTVSPLGELVKLSGFTMYGIESDNGNWVEDEKIAYAGSLAVKYEFLTASFECLGSVYQTSPTDQKKIDIGYSTLLKADVDKFSFIGRYDVQNRDKSTTTKGYARLIVGISYKISEKVTIAIDNQIKQNQDKIAPRENIGYVHLDFGY